MTQIILRIAPQRMLSAEAGLALGLMAAFAINAICLFSLI